MKTLSLKTPLAITVLVIIWGLAYPIYKHALTFTPPVLFAGMRTLIGGLLLAIFLIPKWNNINWCENWIMYCLSALLNTILFFGLQTVGLVYLPGGLLTVLVYFQPVLVALFASIWLDEQMSKLKLIGLIVGFLGIVTISADGLTGKISIIGIVLAILTAVSWALGTVYVKKVSKQVDFLWMIALQVIIGGIVLTIIGVMLEEFSTIDWNLEYVFALGYGATFGIPIAYILYFWLINSGDSGKIASFTFLVPLISVLVGTVFMSEPFTFSLLIGLILVVLSINFVNYSGKKEFNNS